jgi:hypothetical protein
MCPAPCIHMLNKICISRAHKFVATKTRPQQQAYFLLYFVVFHTPTFVNLLTAAAMNLDPGPTLDNGYMLDISSSKILGEAFLPSLSGFDNDEMDCDDAFLAHLLIHCLPLFHQTTLLPLSMHFQLNE